MNEFIDFLLENFTCASVGLAVQKHNLEMLVDHAWGKEEEEEVVVRLGSGWMHELWLLRRRVAQTGKFLKETQTKRSFLVAR